MVPTDIFCRPERRPKASLSQTHLLFSPYAWPVVSLRFSVDVLFSAFTRLDDVFYEQKLSEYGAHFQISLVAYLGFADDFDALCLCHFFLFHDACAIASWF